MKWKLSGTQMFVCVVFYLRPICYALQPHNAIPIQTRDTKFSRCRAAERLEPFRPWKHMIVVAFIYGVYRFLQHILFHVNM